MQNTLNRSNAWGADLRREDRPGVPKETHPPAPIASAAWTSLEQQVEGPIAVRGPLRPLTPVYGTASPPRGLSGIVRRAAYRVPDYKPRRWVLLLLADRIDIFEHTVAPIATLLGGVAAIVGGVYLVRRLRDA